MNLLAFVRIYHCTTLILDDTWDHDLAIVKSLYKLLASDQYFIGLNSRFLIHCLPFSFSWGFGMGCEFWGLANGEKETWHRMPIRLPVSISTEIDSWVGILTLDYIPPEVGGEGENKWGLACRCLFLFTAFY